jgi:rod shape-determining protein MreD
MKAQGTSIVWLTLILALLLEIMPMPAWTHLIRPDWLLIVLTYWGLSLPHKYSVFTACFLGIVLDFMLGATIGARGLVLTINIYLVSLNYQKLRNFPVWQQALVLSINSLIYHVVLFWIEYIISKTTFNPTLLLPVFSNMVIWPWVYWLLKQVRRHFKVK